MIKLPESIKWIITDFDGVVTDNCVYIHDDGVMARKLNFKDVIGFSMLRKKGYNIAIISGEKNFAIETLSKKFQIDEVHQNIRIDDINDFACLEYARYKITVPHAPEKLKNIQDIQVTEKDGGEGAFREVADCLAG